MAEVIGVGDQFEAMPEGVNVSFEPLQHASAMQIALLNNEFSVVFTSPHVGSMVVGEHRQTVATNVPVASLILSPQSVKDFALLLTKAITDYEADWGTVPTAYSRKLENDQAK